MGRRAAALHENGADGRILIAPAIKSLNAHMPICVGAQRSLCVRRQRNRVVSVSGP